MITNPADYKVGLYIRLSDEDDGIETQSESVVNQQKILNEFARRERLRVVDTYIDDGWTGTNFDRPSFQRLVRDIEAGRINMVVTKDLSRLGRDYITTGHYLERYFPEHRVRYIAIDNGIDTGDTSAANDMIPFLSVMNDMYAKDISRKVRSVLAIKRRNGEYVGSTPPYGYKRDPQDRGHLVIDEEAAQTVRYIFDMAVAGYGLTRITRDLNTRGIPSPAVHVHKKDSGLWDRTSVRRLLKNVVYTGVLAQGRTTKVNYKSKMSVNVPPEKWTVTANAHQPIVSQETFDAAKRSLESRAQTRDRTYDYLLKGMLFCHECGHKISVERRDRKFRTTCSYYRYASPPLRYKICSRHNMLLDDVTKAVVKTVRKICEKYLDPRRLEEIARKAIEEAGERSVLAENTSNLKIKLDATTKRIDKIYADRLDGLLAEDDFDRLYKKLCDERQRLRDQLREAQSRSEHEGQDAAMARELAQRFIDEAPSREMLLALIDRIELTNDKCLIIKFRFAGMQNQEV